MYTALYLLAGLTVAFGMVPLALSYRFRKYVEDVLTRPVLPYTPPLTLVLPCKGVDPGFADNIRALLSQDYPDYEVIFVTATEDDPAVDALRELMARSANGIPPAKMIVAGIVQNRGQKITNILAAIKNARPSSEIFAFVDSDIRPEPNFLTHLVRPLRDPRVGVTTGIRWYLPQLTNLGSILRSVWAAGAYPLLIDQRHNFAWGGANASRKETFYDAGIPALLENSISDTFSITHGVKRAGLSVFFVPQCVVVSHEDSSLLETIEWTNRQTIISKVYSPRFWWMVFLSYSFSSAMLALGIVLVVLSGTANGRLAFPGITMLSIIPLQMLNAAFLLPEITKILPDHKDRLVELRWRYILAAPLTSILIMVNSITSLITNEITWRGVRYRLRSPSQTEILSTR